jgi:hypothetical protein
MTRKGMKIFLALAFIYYISIFVLIPQARSAVARLTPQRDPANVLYGNLAALEFVDKPLLNTDRTYVLNTKNGKLPSFPHKLPVYKFKPYGFSYEAGKNARRDAQTLGFTDEELVTDLKGNNYRWKNSLTGSTLDIQIDTRVLSATTPLSGKANFFSKSKVTKETASNQAKTLFGSLNRFSDQLYKNGTQVVKLGKFDGQQVVEATNQSEATLARVDFFRNVMEYPVFGPDPKKGLLHTILRKNDPLNPTLNYPIVEAYYWEVEGPSNATYPLVPVSQVWDEVKKGNGVVANVTPKDANPFEEYRPVRVDRIFINNIYVAYYETPKFQEHLQPIYVFEGNYTSSAGGAGDITVYYPAVDGQYVKSVPSQ